MCQFGGAVAGGHIGVADGLGINVGDGSEGNQRIAVMSGGGVRVHNGGISKSDCCRLPGVIREP